ncbi:MAG: hypothetical protein HY716_08035 [Planctomycetes bacterium]|nr:hypothetical protein [Planctomycetota bacterium]
MSKRPKRPLAEIEPVAVDLVQRLRPACERVAVVGSIRRQSPMVGDIEFVAIPRFEPRPLPMQLSLWGHPREKLTKPTNMLWETLDRLGVKYTKEGPIYRQFTWQGVQVDVYTCELGNWGWILFHRTGPGDLRARIGSMLVERGYAAADGWIWDAREGKLSIDRVVTPEEEDVFRILGIPYVPPERRNDWKP